MRMDTSWMERAECRAGRRDPKLFFAQVDDVRKDLRAEERRVAHAKEVCAVCAVQDQCLGYALTRPERYGVWGGTDKGERDWLRKRLSHQERVLGLVGGMKKVPDGVHRRPAGPGRPPEWYDIWYTVPGGDRSVLVGQTKRQERHLTHKAFSVVPGQHPQVIVGWVAAVTWLLQVWQAREKTSDHCTAVETETVRIA
jgi:WhiB family transcriptional regulator, redox-sensing transcriptional regulator